ncbi:putative acyl-CoA dehydrogenase 6-like protein [Leptotrombidium deliense]|uniref:Putative acyl-CoA dehydrogenase 6-like protein n=1 Tax=Leptotrombidium deliense TaxID=299467 RepID=A0A443S7B1_9ACAR|nr:putative acyl-CoA dehydrogenase 6-like protein [Leptotrombidium deliense]
MSEERAAMKDNSNPWYVGWSNCNPVLANILRQHYTKPYFLPSNSESSRIDWIFMGVPGYGAHLHVITNIHLRDVANEKRLFSTTSGRCLQFTSQHEEMKTTVRKIVEKDVNPFVDQWEKEGMFDAHLVFKKFGNAGLLGITRDPEYNGSGLDYSFTVAMYEELGYQVNAGGIITGIGVQTDMAIPALVNFGSDELKRQFLAPSLSGDFVACVGISEPEGGSDVAAIKTTAKRDGDDYIINGGKMWISNGYQADWMCVLCNTSEGKPHKNKSLICLPLNTPGVTKARRIPKMGHLCSDTAQLFFDNVRVPVKYRIGEEGMGFTYQMMQFQDERMVAAISTIGGLDRMIDSTIEYCKQRKAFGQQIINYQSIHFKLAELRSEVELLRSLVYRTADKMMEGENVTYLASIAKLKSARLLRIVSDSCLQYWGAMGYSDETLISRAYRDARLMSIAGGTDEIMLGIIAKFMNILPK